MRSFIKTSIYWSANDELEKSESSRRGGEEKEMPVVSQAESKSHAQTLKAHGMCLTLWLEMLMSQGVCGDECGMSKGQSKRRLRPLGSLLSYVSILSGRISLS